MAGKIDVILNEVFEKINPSENELKVINENLLDFMDKIKKRIKKFKIDCDVFVGGSFPKRTIIKKDFYDVDLFLRYGKRYSEKDYPKLSRKILGFTKGIIVIHGSRDYFKVKVSPTVFFEVVPVKRIKNPKEALNITDLSYFHVNYIKKKIKLKKVLEGVRFAKAFCHASKTYGAESYVKGFSGYSLELLIYYFKSFENFLKILSKKRSEKLIIDIEKQYKKENVLFDMNGSKLDSPVILVDPTYKARNVLAALSYETYERFRESAASFLKKPSKEFFEYKKIDFNKSKSGAEKKGLEFLKIRIKTKKERGDIAGTKLLKFFNHMAKELEKYFEIRYKDFEYSGGKAGEGYFTLKSRREIEFRGPFVKDKKNLIKFKKEHTKTYEKKGRVYAFEKIDFSPGEFLGKWVEKNKKKIKEMSINGVEGG
ncbi:hypothetical protein J4411_01045 [Candidatus Pacearchaeota archaeon]|nr:hypothetical protein [uncultured archaeon]MBS3084480.1 hypothetical protein [Candidatus Pacearchaeota archaeon]